MPPFKIYQEGIQRILPQKEKSDVIRDKGRGALPPGKRVSRTGKTYWETRKNRTDQIGSNT
jgi:hypothetical protein